MREKEADINCLTSSGIPQPLGRIKRLHKWDTTNTVPDDGFVSEACNTIERILNNQTDRTLKSKRSPNARETNSENDQ